MIWRDKNNVLWILIISTLILLWGSIPNWVGQLTQTRDVHFRGIYFDSQDYAVDISMMRAGAQGQWAYEFRFTTEPPHPAYLRMFYIFLGHISKWTRIPPEQTFELARWLLGFTALFALYALLNRIFADHFWTRIAFLLAVFGSGAGWLQLIFHWDPGLITPIDFWFIDAYFFFSLTLFPHFAFALTGMSIACLFWLNYLETHHWRNLMGFAITAILVQFTNPIAFAVVDMGIAGAMLFTGWRERRIPWRDVGALAVLAFVQLPLLAYYFFVLTRDPNWSQYTIQNQTLSPPPIYYLWGFVLLWPFALAGSFVAVRTKLPVLGMAVFWAMAAFLLAYAPFYIQRRFLLGITIPLTILAIWAMRELVETFTQKHPTWARWRTSAVMSFVFLASFSSIYLSIGQALYLRTYPKEFFYPASVDEAAKWLSQNAKANDFVLASKQTSQIIAQKTDLRVYFGHEMETLAFDAKQEEVKSFYNGSKSDAWLKNAKVSWVIYGPLERSLNQNFRPSQVLRLVYIYQDIQIYATK